MAIFTRTDGKFIISNVNPGLINPRRLFGRVPVPFKYWMKWLLEEYPLIENNNGLFNPGLTLSNKNMDLVGSIWRFTGDFYGSVYA